ncbi:MAG TPA: arginine--tRNA ligase [Candidatus Saccharimonadales bacterium]|nr:arginine--tRNA ligase [Candidatus Saccharimonadales bacterium]
MKQELEKQILAAVQALFNVDVHVELSRPEEQFGDYASNVAMQLSKQLGKNPREIADQLKPKLEELDLVSGVEVAGPGFLNLKLTDAALVQAAQIEPAKSLAGKVVVAEYSDPNPFKVLHAGHLYTSVVGDSIANLLELAGAEVHRVNFGGDVGMHVAKTMWAIIKQFGGEDPQQLNDIPADQHAEWMAAAYIEGTNAFEDDESAKAEIVVLNKRVYQLHNENDHDSPFAQIYWTCRQWAYDYFDAFYDRIGTKFEKYYPESQTAPLGLETVRAHIGEVYQESDGAIVFDGEKHGLHTRVFINSEGLPTYEAKDVGLVILKKRDYNFDRSVVITGNEQLQYMSVVLKSIEQFEPELAANTTHLTHGLVKLQGGVKMSSRKGNILRAVDVLDEATEAVKALGQSEDDQIVLGAVKYSFLRQRMGGDIVYDPKESVSLEGNSGPYLQYAHARARSVLARAAESSHADGAQLRSDAHVPQARSASVLPDHPSSHDATAALNGVEFENGERSLIRKIGEYTEVVNKAVNELMPHHICTYLYELAQTFNRFYENNRVVGDEREKIRLALVQRYAETLRSGLSLLGITAPDKM